LSRSFETNRGISHNYDEVAYRMHGSFGDAPKRRSSIADVGTRFHWSNK
jgi:hypothetical protein